MLLVGAGCGSSSSSSGLTTDGGTTDGGANQADVTVQQTNLVTDVAAGGGARVDPNLVNPWGIAASGQGPFWISDNGKGLASVFDSSGTETRTAVTIPAPTGSTSSTSAPTGAVFNIDTSRFKGDIFLFATEDGTIAGWQSGNVASIRVDKSQAGAIYKGLTIANNKIYAANFNAGTIDMFDTNFADAGTLTDSNMPTGFAPFNIARIGTKVYVSFAKQDANKKDDVAGVGNGFIDVIDPLTNQMTRLVSNDALNSPWGMALAPTNFGAASDMLLVGNFGDGLIHVFDPTSGARVGQLQKSGAPLIIEGLWGLAFGNDGAAGPLNTLFFTAGPGDEQHGLFGKLEVSP
jgi:uncharacterized protein (TIGR03118 family)